MKRLLFFLISLISYTSYAQVSLIDSIKAVSSFQNQSELGEIYRKSGISFKNKGQYQKAEQCYSESLRIYTSVQDTIGIADVYNNLGLLHFINSDHNIALENYYKSLRLNDAIRNKLGLIKNYLNLGNFFYFQKDFQKSLSFYYQCEELLIGQSNRYFSASVHLGIGNILSQIDYNNRDFNKAQKEYLSALNIYRELGDSLSMSRVYNNLGTISFEQQKYTSAIDYFNKGLQIKKVLSDKKGMLVTYLNIGNAYLDKKDYNNSLVYYDKGKEIAQEISDGENYLHILSNLVNVYMELGKVDSAALLFSEYNLLRDSIFNEEKARQLTELQTLYETEKTARELDEQKALSEEKAFQNKVLFVIAVALGLLSFAVVTLYTQKQRAVNRLREQEEELYQKELSRLQREQYIQSFQAMIEGEDQERKRIAEDLHDRIGSKLSAIKLFHESTHHQTCKFSRIDEMLNETINETRQIAHNLAPSALTKYGLIQAIQDLLDTLDSTDSIDAQFSHINISERLPKKIETALYYIVQELVTNTLRHSEASSLSVQLGLHDNQVLNLCYEDNGKGFDPDTLSTDSMGLRNIRTRLSPFSGDLSIDSSLNHGATFIIDIDVSQIFTKKV